MRRFVVIVLTFVVVGCTEKQEGFHEREIAVDQPKWTIMWGLVSRSNAQL